MSFVSKAELAARCMHAKKIEEECLKPEPVIDEMSEQFIVNLETDSDNFDTESSRETSGWLK
jgi:hypothetical protein